MATTTKKQPKVKIVIHDKKFWRVLDDGSLAPIKLGRHQSFNAANEAKQFIERGRP